MAATRGLAYALIGLLLACTAGADEIVLEELVSVTDDGFVLAWFTSEPQPSEVYYGPARDELYLLASDPQPTTAHVIEVTGLDPDSIYHYLPVSGDAVRAEPVHELSPGWVHTLVTPPGEYLFSFATLNDTHVGEDVAGLLGFGPISLTPGFTWDDPANPYWYFMNASAVDGVNGRGVDLVIHKGDVTADNAEDQALNAKAIFDGLDAPIHYVRGNHDRVQHDADYFADVFDVTEPDRVVDIGDVRFVLMDSNDADGQPQLSDGQLAWLDAVLAEAEALGLRAFLIAHHKFYGEAMRMYGIDAEASALVMAILAAHPVVVGMLAGHSHRAWVDRGPWPALVPFVETPSTKEYPGGYAVVRVYEGGYTHTFFRSTCAECLEWSRITRGEYFGLAPFLQMGPADRRNFTYVYPDWRDLPEDEPDDDEPDGSDEGDGGDSGCG